MPVLSRKPGGSGGSGGAPSGPAGGDLTGTYPDPTISTSVISAYGRTLVDDASASAARTTLGMGVAWAGYALVSEEFTSGTDGGSSTSATWNIRALNTEVFDVGTIVSVAANRFTLAAGTYYLRAYSIIGGNSARVRSRVYNVTDASAALYGPSMYSGEVGGFMAIPVPVEGRLTIAGTKAFELQSYTGVGVSTEGLGSSSDIASVNEVYAQVEIWKEA